MNLYLAPSSLNGKAYLAPQVKAVVVTPPTDTPLQVAVQYIYMPRSKLKVVRFAF